MSGVVVGSKSSSSRAASLVIEPVDRAVLQVRERIVAGGAGKFVLAQHRLLLPGVGEIGRVRRHLAVDPVAALHGLAAVPPPGDALGVDHLTLDVHAGDEEAVAGVLEVLEDRARVLTHEDRVRRVVVDAELVADAVALADLVERDPHPGRVADVVVEVVARRPAGHRALLDPILQTAGLGLLEQRHEALLEVDQVLIHRLGLVAADEARHRRHAEQRCGVHHGEHEVVLLAADRRVLVQHVVEVADVGDRDTGRVDGREHPLRPHLVERLAQIERVRDRIEHRFGRDVGERRVQRRGELDAVGVEGDREIEPLLDRPDRDPGRVARGA